jgi:hypothetical protein
MVYYYVSANLVEDFSGLSKEDLANAPVFKLESLLLILVRYLVPPKRSGVQIH